MILTRKVPNSPYLVMNLNLSHASVAFSGVGMFIDETVYYNILEKTASEAFH